MGGAWHEGKWVPSLVGGVSCNAFVPHPLSPKPSLCPDAALQTRIHEASLALGRLDAVSALLPDARLFLYSYVRKEAVM